MKLKNKNVKICKENKKVRGKVLHLSFYFNIYI